MQKDSHLNQKSKNKNSCLTGKIGRLPKIAYISVALALSTGCTEMTAEDHLQNARNYIEANEKNSAVVELKSAIQKAPQNAELRFELGKIYTELEEFDVAEKELSRAVDLGFDKNQIIPFLAMSYQKIGNFVALSNLELSEYSLSNDKFLEVGYRKLISLLELRREGSAKLLIRNLLSKSSSTVYKDLIKAISLSLDNQSDVVSGLLEKAISKEPNNKDVLFTSADLYDFNGQTDKAIEVLKLYVELTPDDTTTKFRYATMLVRDGQTEIAESHIDTLLEINNQNAFLNQLKGMVRAADNDFKDALIFAEKSIATGRKDPGLFLLAGVSAFNVNQHSKVVDYIGSIQNSLPDDHPGLRLLAYSQLQTNKIVDANTTLQRFANQTQVDSTLLLNAGYTALLAGDAKSTVQYLDNVPPEVLMPEQKFLLGTLKLSVGDVSGILELENLAAMESASDQIKLSLGSTYISNKEFEKAFTFAENLKENSSRKIGLFIEISAYVEQNQFKKARQILTAALDEFPNEPSLLAVNIRLAYIEGDTQQSLDTAKLLRELDSDNTLALVYMFNILKQQDEHSGLYEEIINGGLESNSSDEFKIFASALANSEGKPLDALRILNDTKFSVLTPRIFWEIKGRALSISNDFSGLKSHFVHWNKTQPNNINALLNLVGLFDATKSYDDAIGVIEKFLVSNNTSSANLLYSYFLAKANRYNDAKKVWAQLDNQILTTPLAADVSARLAIMEGRAKDALKPAERAYNSFRAFDSLSLLVEAMKKNNELDAAIRTVDSHISEVRKDPSSLLLKASLLYENESTEVLKQYEEVLTIQPDNVIALNNIAYLHNRSGNISKALSYSHQAYKLASENISIADTYAQALVANNRLDEALNVYTKMSSREIKNEKVLLNFAETLAKSGNKTAAISKLNNFQFLEQVSRDRRRAIIKRFGLSE